MPASPRYYESAEARPANVTEVACWAHVRRKFFDVHKANGSPIAHEALERIGALFEIERTIAGKSPEQRRAVRQSLAKEKLGKLAEWLDQQLKLLSGKGGLRRRHPLCPITLGRADGLRRRRAVGNLQQRGGERDPARHVGSQELALCRQRCGR